MNNTKKTINFKSLLLLLSIFSITFLFSCDKKEEIPAKEKKENIISGKNKEEEENNNNNNANGNENTNGNTNENNENGNTNGNENGNTNGNENENTNENGNDNQNGNENTTAPEPTKADLVSIYFTSQMCSYCPKQAYYLKKNSKTYPENRCILITFHDRQSESYVTNLYNKFSEDYHKYLRSIKVIPKGHPVFLYNSLGSFTDDRYTNDMVKDLSLLSMKTNVTKNNNKLNIEFKAIFCKGQKERAKDKKFNVIVLVTEDIKGYQADIEHKGGAWKNDYPHTNVCRGSLNSLWGTSYEIGSTYTLKNKEIPADVVDIKNSKIIILVLESDNKRIVGFDEYKL